MAILVTMDYCRLEPQKAKDCVNNTMADVSLPKLRTAFMVTRAHVSCAAFSIHRKSVNYM